MDFNKIEVCSIDDHGIWCMNLRRGINNNEITEIK